MMPTFTTTTTRGFRALAVDSEGRNRGPNQRLLDSLDPSGVHVCALVIPHNEVEWRAMWLCKLVGNPAPQTIWMDNSFDAFERLTTKMPAPTPADA